MTRPIFLINRGEPSGEPNDEEMLSLESDFRRRFLLFFEGLGFTGAGTGAVACGAAALGNMPLTGATIEGVVTVVTMAPGNNGESDMALTADAGMTLMAPLASIFDPAIENVMFCPAAAAFDKGKYEICVVGLLTMFTMATDAGSDSSSGDDVTPRATPSTNGNFPTACLPTIPCVVLSRCLDIMLLRATDVISGGMLISGGLACGGVRGSEAASVRMATLGA